MKEAIQANAVNHLDYSLGKSISFDYEEIFPEINGIDGSDRR